MYNMRPPNFKLPKGEALLDDVRRAGGWRPYVRYPRFRLLMLRIVVEQGRAETKDPLLVRLFPSGPLVATPMTRRLLAKAHAAPDAAAILKRALEAALVDQRHGLKIDVDALAATATRALTALSPKRLRGAYRAQKGGRLPRGIFMHIIGYWRSSRDYLGPAPDGA